MIDLPKEARQRAIASIQRYFDEHMDEPIGNVAAGGLLGFFLEEIGPVVYTRRSPTCRSACSRASWNSTPRSMRTSSPIGARWSGSARVSDGARLNLNHRATESTEGIQN